MGKFFCVYSGCECDESQRSTEHIVPVAIGGSDNFTIDDVSRKANNDLGRRADAGLVDSLFIRIERQRHQISGRNGVPDVSLPGTVNIGGTKVPAKLTFGQTAGDDRLWIKPSVKRVGPGLFEVSCHKNDMPRILADLQRKGGGGTAHIETVGTTAVATIDASLAYREDELWRGYIKMALAVGHRVLGGWFSRSEIATLLRSVLNTPDGINWSTIPIRGQMWPHAGHDQNLFNRTLSCGDNRHVLLLLNTDAGVAFNALLFGKYNASIQLATQRSDVVGHGCVMVIDATSRTLVEMSFDEFVMRRLERQPPFEDVPAVPLEVIGDETMKGRPGG